MIRLAAFINNLALTAISLFKVLLNSKFFRKQIHYLSSNSDLIVLGNGPSLKTNIENNLEFINSKNKICVNGFAISKDYELLKPEYYLIADYAFWIDKPSERVKLFRDEVFNAIKAKTSWALVLFLPFETRKSKYLKLAFDDNKHITIKYFNKTTIKGFQGFCNAMYKLNLGIPRPQNVMVPCLILGINMGFKRLYILGADHSWHEDLVVTDENILCARDRHFYDNQVKLIPILDGHGKQTYLHQQFESLMIAFRNYHIIQKYAEYCGVEILNASEKSYIDAFKRVKI